MIEIRVNSATLEYEITYRIDSVIATGMMTASLDMALEEIEKKVRLEMGRVKGKRFTCQTGREI